MQNIDPAKLLATIIAGASLAWGTYVSKEVVSVKVSVGRIEAKLDGIKERLDRSGK